MVLPDLYLEGLRQRSLAGLERLNTYKLGLIEAILKEALNADASRDPEALRTGAQTALEVARWEARPW